MLCSASYCAMLNVWWQLSSHTHTHTIQHYMYLYVVYSYIISARMISARFRKYIVWAYYVPQSIANQAHNCCGCARASGCNLDQVSGWNFTIH